MERIVLFLFSISFIVLSSSCNQKNTESYDASDVVASYKNKHLTKTEILERIPKGLSSADSIQYARVYVEKWARNTILLGEAENGLKSDQEIETLVSSYRASLLLLNFENEYLKENLDSIISKEQLLSYYEKHKEEYRTNQIIIKASLAKFSKETKGLDAFFSNWKAYVKSNRNEYLERNALVWLKHDWYTANELMSVLPNSIVKLKTLSLGSTIQKQAGDHEYFLFVDEKISAGEVPPLAYISDQLKKIILQKRKSEILQQYKEELYQKNLEKGKIKINLE